MSHYIVWLRPQKLFLKVKEFFLPPRTTFLCKLAQASLITHVYLTALPATHSHVLFCFSFHEQRDTDASCSHLSTIKTNTGFDKRMRPGPCGPCVVCRDG